MWAFRNDLKIKLKKKKKNKERERERERDVVIDLSLGLTVYSKTKPPLHFPKIVYVCICSSIMMIVFRYNQNLPNTQYHMVLVFRTALSF